MFRCFESFVVPGFDDVFTVCCRGVELGELQQFQGAFCRTSATSIVVSQKKVFRDARRLGLEFGLHFC